MPIPTGGAWPPPEYAPAYSAYRDWDAWYSGSLPKLRAVYGNRDASGVSLSPSQRVRAGQTAGGVVGLLSRWLWGNPPSAGQRDGRVHVPLPVDVTRAKASLILAEAPKLTASTPAAQERLEQLEQDGLTRMLAGAAAACSALGDVYLRPVVDPEVAADRAILAPVHADGALPVIRWGKLVEVTFWQNVLVDGDKYFRLLEHHDVVDRRGRLVYALHEGTHDKLGEKVPFTRLASTAYLAGEGFTNGVQETGLDRLDVVRIPNTDDQPLWRTEPTLKYLGRSDFDGSEQWFDRLDETWTSWLRDLHLARGRIIVPDYMLKSGGPGSGATFDAEQEVFRGMKMLPDEKGRSEITPVQFEIRWEEHKATADGIVEIAMRHAGLAQQTMGAEGGDVAMTATESSSRANLSANTKGLMVQAWGSGIPDAIELLMAVEQHHRLKLATAPERPKIEFADGIVQTPEAVATTIQLLAAANAISTYTKVKMAHPEWEEREIKEEVARIQGDQDRMNVQDPDAFTGGGKPGGDDEADPEGEKPPAE